MLIIILILTIKVSSTFLCTFHTGLSGLCSNDFWTSSYKDDLAQAFTINYFHILNLKAYSWV